MKTEKQLTAVEWLEERYKANGSYLTKSDINAAKEMEKEQMINARQSGIDATINGKSISNIDYYNETFKSE